MYFAFHYSRILWITFSLGYMLNGLMVYFARPICSSAKLVCVLITDLHSKAPEVITGTGTDSTSLVVVGTVSGS